MLIMGDMFELGSLAENEHQAIVNYLEENSLGTSYLIGSNFFKTNTKSQGIHKFESFDMLKEQLNNTSFKENTILIKASRGMALERILDLI